MSSSNLVVSRHVERIADHILMKKPFLASIARCKLYYLIIKKHHRNWLVGSPSETQIEEGFGIWDLEDDLKMTDDHVARVASFSPGQPFLVSVFNRITAQTGYCRQSFTF